MKKKGAAIFSVVVVLVVISILTGTVVYNSNNNLKMAELKEFSQELKTVEMFFNEYLDENNEYGSSGTISVNVGENEAFKEEKKINGEVNFYKIDLNKIGVVSSKRGKEEASGDVYAFSPFTKKIYYLNGVQDYYSLTPELEERVNILK